ncbi:dTMP kinase, partial [Calditerricola satsumensis]|uniref:dTMP kinase n=1 Tax=Calditerricola satsumensis TaxID=373054 RepID=UPI0035710F16
PRAARRGQGADRIEQKALAYHQRVREAFLRLAANDPQRIRVLDASRPEEEIAREIAADCWALCRRLQLETGGSKDEAGCGGGPGQG